MYQITHSWPPCQSNAHLGEGIPSLVVYRHHANGNLYLCCKCASRKWTTMQKEGARAYFIGDEYREIEHKTELKDKA